MKKIISILLCVIMSISLIELPCNSIETLAAQNNTKLVLENKTASPGETITVTVSIENNSGFSYLELTPSYDNSLELLSMENGDLFADSDFTYFEDGNQCFWLSATNITTNGLLAKMTFKVSAEVEEGDYNVGFVLRNCYNEEENPVAIDVNSGTVTVEEKETSTPTIKVDKVSAKAEELVDVKISLIDNPGIAYAFLKVTYGEGITCKKIVYDPGFGGRGTVPKKKNSPIKLTWENEDGNSTSDGTFAILTFEVDEGITNETIPIEITYNPDDLYNFDEDNVNFAIENGCVEVTPIEYASISVGESLRLKAIAEVPEEVKSPRMRFIQNGKETSYYGTYNSKEEKWSFEYPGITAKCMSDNITMELLDDDSEVIGAKNYSVKEYCNTLYYMTASELNISETKKEALDVFIADMLEYGAATQQYIGYNTDNLANSLSWVALEKTSTFNTPESDKKITSKAKSSDNIIQSATLRLDNCIEPLYYIKATTATHVVISDGTESNIEYFSDLTEVGGRYVVGNQQLAATELGNKFTVSLMEGDEVLHQITYSVNSYVASKCNDADKNLANLVKAICNYGVSAKGYKN